jgi:hypothetical protein
MRTDIDESEEASEPSPSTGADSAAPHTIPSGVLSGAPVTAPGVAGSVNARVVYPEASHVPLLELLDTLQQHQVRNAGAEVAAAVAHAMGTALNVISGRAELIRQNPAGALAQVVRIEEQVQKLATGLRQLVDYLTVPEATLIAGEEPNVVPAVAVVEQACALALPLAGARGVALGVNSSGLGSAVVDRWHVLATLNTLLGIAVHWAGSLEATAASKRLQLRAHAADGWAIFELCVPQLEALAGWELEHFRVRPPATPTGAPYRMLSICAATVRGRGGKLQVESLPEQASALIRFSCRTGSGAS